MMDRASCTLYYSFGLSSLSLPFELSVLLSSVAYADHSTFPPYPPRGSASRSVHIAFPEPTYQALTLPTLIPLITPEAKADEPLRTPQM